MALTWSIRREGVWFFVLINGKRKGPWFGARRDAEIYAKRTAGLVKALKVRWANREARA